MVSSGCGPSKEDYEPIDELVDEENAAESGIIRSSARSPQLQMNIKN